MDPLIEKLEGLEALARQLEPDRRWRREVVHEALDYGDQFLDQLNEMNAYVSGDENDAFPSLEIAEEPQAMEVALRFLARHVDRTGINPASGSHLGYIPGGGVYTAAIGDYLSDVSNRYAGVSFAGPGAVQLEKALLAWIASLIGFPANSGGDLTSGGSMANLSGIIVAREAHQIRSGDIPGAVAYLSAHVHHSVDKALRVAGLGECTTRYLPLDSEYRLVPEALSEAIQRDREAGLRPWLLVASAGTTDVGAVDPLGQLADICEAQSLWFHVDAAYGGFFALCDETQKTLSGLARADSVVMDPHKGLFLPYGSGALLVRDLGAMQRAFHYSANYMQDATRDASTLSPADLSPELSRPFRGLRLWLPLMLHGLAPFRAALEEKLCLARYFYREIQTIPGYEVGPEPQLSVVTYRYVPASGDADAFNKELVSRIQSDGRVFISSTTIDGRFMLRLAILNFRTHREQVDRALAILRETACALESESSEVATR